MKNFTDNMTLLCKSRRFSVYFKAKDGFDMYCLTLAGRRDCWIFIEDVYPTGEVRRFWRNCGYTFDFGKMTWVKD